MHRLNNYVDKFLNKYQLSRSSFYREGKSTQFFRSSNVAYKVTAKSLPEAVAMRALVGYPAGEVFDKKNYTNATNRKQGNVESRGVLRVNSKLKPTITFAFIGSDPSTPVERPETLVADNVRRTANAPQEASTILNDLLRKKNFAQIEW